MSKEILSKPATLLQKSHLNVLEIPRSNYVWLDTDGDMDDLMSMALMSSCPKNKVIGISPNGIGASYLENNLRWVIGMNKQLKFNYQVIAGKTTPSSYSNRYPYDATLFANENFGLKYPNYNNDDFSNNDQFIASLQKITTKFDLMIYGGATNWIEIIEKYPAIIDKVNFVYLYAGIINKDQNSQIGIAGNIKEAFNFQSPYDNNVAEWNVFVDSVAMRKIIDFFQDKVILFPINLSVNLDFNDDFCTKLKNINNDSAKIWVQIIDYLKQKQALSYIKIWSQVATIFYLSTNDETSKNTIIETHNVDIVTSYTVNNDQNGKVILNSNKSNKTKVMMAIDEGFVYNKILEILKNKI